MLLAFISLRRSFNTNRFFHRSRPQRLPPWFWASGKLVLKGFAALTGRQTREWYRRLPKRKFDTLMKHLERQQLKYIGIFSSLSTLVAFHYYTHFETTAITNRKRYVCVSRKEINVLSEIARKEFEKQYENSIVSEKHSLSRLITGVVQNILKSNTDVPEIDTIKWSVRVVKDEICNAFVLPTGHIYVTTGLLEICDNVDQLAIVLSHEMSHALLNHTAEEISHNRILVLPGIFIIFLLWSILPTDLTAGLAHFVYENFIRFGFTLPYSRRLEQEADEVGLILAAKACFDVRQAIVFWKKPVSILDILTDGKDFYSTHPSGQNRAANLHKKLPNALILRCNCGCPPVDEKKDVYQTIDDIYYS